MNFEEQLAADVREIEEILKRYLPRKRDMRRRWRKR